MWNLQPACFARHVKVGGTRLLPAELVGVDYGDIVICIKSKIFLCLLHLAFEALNATDVEKELVSASGSWLRSGCL